jgi:hypothetical protein
MHRIAVLAAGLLAASLAAGCVVVTPPAVQPDEPPEVEGSDAFTYFIVTRVDMRRCAYPLCGGVFVKRVNRVTTVCADGVPAAECHVAKLDLDALGLGDDQDAALSSAFAERHALLRGSLARRDEGLPFPVETLVATEGWRGAANSVPTGRFSRLTDTGVRCVTFPCPVFLEQLLDTNLRQVVAEVDLAASGADKLQVDQGINELGTTGILAAGSTFTVSGPAGVAAGFRASEFYLRVRPE